MRAGTVVERRHPTRDDHAQRGIPSVEVANLEELARDRVCEFAFVAASPPVPASAACGGC